MISFLCVFSCQVEGVFDYFRPFANITNMSYSLWLSVRRRLAVCDYFLHTGVFSISSVYKFVFIGEFLT